MEQVKVTEEEEDSENSQKMTLKSGQEAAFEHKRVLLKTRELWPILITDASIVSPH